MKKEIWEKLQKTKTLLKTVFFHEDYYVDSVLAAFASASNLMLLGERGTGKTHVCEALINMIDSEITQTVQGYLSADLEDVFARLKIPSLMNGEEKIVWKKVVTARVKFFDEIQRLGAGALSAMFRVLTKGTVLWLEQEKGAREFFTLATANPQEVDYDVLNIRLPEPLHDRFHGILVVPSAKLKYQIKINKNAEKMKESLPVIWKEQDLLELWRDCEQVKIPPEIDLIATLMNRIMQYCKFAQGHDSSTLKRELKRELCSKCNKTYLCSRIARAPSVRAKLAMLQLAQGFAYLEGRQEVTLEDLKKAFPLAYWKRVEFFEDEQIADRMEYLQNFFEQLKREVMEVKEGLTLLEKLKQEFNKEDYEKLKFIANAKGWFFEVIEMLDDHYKQLEQKLKAKYESAKAQNDIVTMAKIYFIAKKKLPEDLANQFYFDHKVKIKLNEKELARLAKVHKDIFDFAKVMYKEGNKEIELQGELALIYIAFSNSNNSKNTRRD